MVICEVGSVIWKICGEVGGLVFYTRAVQRQNTGLPSHTTLSTKDAVLVWISDPTSEGII